MGRAGAGTVLLAAVAAAVMACGGDTGPAAPPVDPPPGPAGVAIQFTTGGGVAGPCCDPWQVPDITAYGDGRVMLAGAGGGPVPEISQVTIGSADISRLLTGARDAGLMEAQPPDTGSLCCDLPYTRVVLADAAATHEFVVTGLGIDAGGDLSAAQVRAREAVAELRAELTALAGQVGEPAPFTAAELAVYVFPASGTEDGAAPAWPLDRPLAEGGTPVAGDGRCLHLADGDEVGSVLAAVRESNGPVWSESGRQWTVFARPLLPHEHDCP